MEHEWSGHGARLTRTPDFIFLPALIWLATIRLHGLRFEAEKKLKRTAQEGVPSLWSRDPKRALPMMAEILPGRFETSLYRQPIT